MAKLLFCLRGHTDGAQSTWASFSYLNLISLPGEKVIHSMYMWSGLLPSSHLSRYLDNWERKYAAEELKAGSVSCWICAGQDTLFKPCRALACLRHAAQEHEAVSQAGSLFWVYATCISWRQPFYHHCRYWFHITFNLMELQAPMKRMASIHLARSHVLAASFESYQLITEQQSRLMEN